MTETEVTLAKASPTIKNSYEIRLALYMAAREQKRFVLAVSPGTVVEPTVSSLLARHGGVLREASVRNYSVYVGHLLPGGDEGDGWVLGDEETWELVRATASPQLRALLHIGKVFSPAEIAELEGLVTRWDTQVLNIDEEPVARAFLALAKEARKRGGEIFIQ